MHCCRSPKRHLVPPFPANKAALSQCLEEWISPSWQLQPIIHSMCFACFVPTPPDGVKFGHPFWGLYCWRAERPEGALLSGAAFGHCFRALLAMSEGGNPTSNLGVSPPEERIRQDTTDAPRRACLGSLFFFYFAIFFVASRERRRRLRRGSKWIGPLKPLQAMRKMA